MKLLHFVAFRALAVTMLLTPLSSALAEAPNNKPDSTGQTPEAQPSPDNQLTQDGEETEFRGMEHAALGVMLSEREGHGVRIRDVLPESPADKAGLRPGDKIIKLDNKPMDNYRQIIHYINRVRPGQTSTMAIQRDGKEESIPVTFASREEIYAAHGQRDIGNRHPAPNLQRDGNSAGNRPRVASRDHNSQNTSRGGQSHERGILGVELENQRGPAIVRAVQPGSPAQRGGLRPGDEIASIDGRAVQNFNDVIHDLQEHHPGDQVSIGVLSNGQRHNLQVRLISKSEFDGHTSRDNNQSQSGDSLNEQQPPSPPEDH